MTYLRRIPHDLQTKKVRCLSILLKVLSWHRQDPTVSIVFFKSCSKQKYMYQHNILVKINYKARNKFISLFLWIFSAVIIKILLWNITRIIQDKYFFHEQELMNPFLWTSYILHPSQRLLPQLLLLSQLSVWAKDATAGWYHTHGDCPAVSAHVLAPHVLMHISFFVFSSVT